jgi:hypothetical protein
VITEQPTAYLIVDKLGIDIIEFRDADSGRLAHVRILILRDARWCFRTRLPERRYLQRAAQWLAEILGNAIHANATHGPHRESTNQGVGVLRVLLSTSSQPRAKTTRKPSTRSFSNIQKAVFLKIQKNKL